MMDPAPDTPPAITDEMLDEATGNVARLRRETRDAEDALNALVLARNTADLAAHGIKPLKTVCVVPRGRWYNNKDIRVVVETASGLRRGYAAVRELTKSGRPHEGRNAFSVEISKLVKEDES
jgi:hypothetical protein